MFDTRAKRLLAFLMSCMQQDCDQRIAGYEGNPNKNKWRNTKKGKRRKKIPKTFGRRKHLKKHKSF